MKSCSPTLLARSISASARPPTCCATPSRAFAADRIAPLAERIDREDWFPRELWPEMGALGLHGITVSEEDGGAGLGYLEHCVAMEEVSRASGSVGLSYGAHSNLCVNQIFRWGDAGAEGALSAKADLRRASRRACDVGGRRRLRRRLDAASRREARRPLRPERHEILDHQRPAGRYARRLCQDRSRRPARAASPPSSSKRRFTGFSVAQKLDKLGMRGSETGELVFQDCEVPEENVLGEVGRGGERADVRPRLRARRCSPPGRSG